MLRLAASVERASEHPLARRDRARPQRARRRRPSPVVDFDSPTGKGARRKGRRASGSRSATRSSSRSSRRRRTAALETEAERTAQRRCDRDLHGGRWQASPASSRSPIRSKASTPEALSGLKAEGVRVVMLTGDNWTTAQAVARRLGIDDVEAEVLPDQKSAVVQRCKAEGRVVAMAGDGVNDAPALAAADVGIAMGTGTDVAMESAGVTLLKGDLTGIVRARRLSQATMRNIRQNLFFAFIYNAAGVPIAAGVLIRCSGCCCRRSSPPRRWRCPRSASSATRCGCGRSASERRACPTNRREVRRSVVANDHGLAVGQE